MTMSKPIAHVGLDKDGPICTVTVTAGAAFVLAHLLREESLRAKDKGYHHMLIEFAQAFEKAAKNV